MPQNRFIHTLKTEEEVNPGDRVKISFLINALYWFTEYAFIIEEENGYRLISIHLGRLLVNKTYKRARNAKIAFTRFFNNKIWKKGIKPIWSPFIRRRPNGLRKSLRISKVRSPALTK